MSTDQKDKRLVEFLENGKDWERKQTNIPGVFHLSFRTYTSNVPQITLQILQ